MLDTVTYLPKLKEFEGVCSHMYLDATGNITVGVGNLLANVAAAQKLAFVLRANPLAKPPVLARPATADEIRADFERVDNQPAGRLATYYKQFTLLDLPSNVIDSLLNGRVQEFTASICAAFRDFDSYPEEACAAIFDMSFNLGLGKLTSQFPNFCKAVKHVDWSTAAAQCHRNGINDARNAWTKAQFEKAEADISSKCKAAGR
jgi:GH24 family phage-related lysozyme (muramidase)